MSKRILVAETEPAVRTLIKEYLSGMDCRVVIAEDGQAALAAVEQELFDLYIVDIYLPGLDGLELMMQIRDIQPQAVIILTTDYSSIDVAANALHKGAFHYLTKPIEVDELERAVDSGLKHSLELDEVGGISPASKEISRELIDLLLLKGFSSEQQNDFQQMGTLVQYKPNEKIPTNEQLGTMIWVEDGRISVQYNGNTVDTLRPGDLWGEETFIGSNTIFTELIVQADSQVRHFTRKKMMDYFKYQDESLIKRFMINLIQCLYFKWKKAIIKVGINPAYPAFYADTGMN
jgi:CheY-like chemotaxis protein